MAIGPIRTKKSQKNDLLFLVREAKNIGATQNNMTEHQTPISNSGAIVPISNSQGHSTRFRLVPNHPSNSQRRFEPSPALSTSALPTPLPRQILPPSAKERATLLATYSPEIQEMVATGQFYDGPLAKLNVTEMTRLAWLDSKTAKYIAKGAGYYPFPLRAEHKLFEHQEQCIVWLREREALQQEGVRGGILCLTMGLMKTLIALAHTLTSAPTEEVNPTLVVCSKTVMSVWYEQIDMFFTDNIRALFFHRDYCKEIDSVSKEEILTYHFVITTYDVVRGSYKSGDHEDEICVKGEKGIHKDKVIAINERQAEQISTHPIFGSNLVHNIAWQRIIADESQKFANPTTILFRAMMALVGKRKLCLTGTPIRNYHTDIWSQLRFLGYTGIKTATEWKRRGAIEYKLRDLVSCVLQLDYSQTKIKLPAKKVVVKEVKLEKMELEMYNYILGLTRKAYHYMVQKLVGYSCVLALFTRLRQCCIAPYLITPQAKRKKGRARRTVNRHEQELLEVVSKLEDEFAKWIYQQDGTAGILSKKIQQVLEIVRELPAGEKIAIFSKFTSCLDLVAKAISTALVERRMVMIDGDVVGRERVLRLRNFREDPTVTIILLSYDVGSEGLSLTSANRVICIEPWWSPAVHKQAVARVWRPGQKKEVTAYVILVKAGEKSSIEKRIADICEEKRKMAAHYLGGRGGKMGSGGLNKQTMARILDI